MKDNGLHVLFSSELLKAEIESVNDCLQQYLSGIARELTILPGGKLYIRYRNCRPTFCNYQNGKIHGITKRTDLIHQLARRRLLLLQKSLIEQLLTVGWTPASFYAIQKQHKEMKDLLLLYADAGLDIDRIVMTPNQLIWNSNRHSQKRNRTEGLIYPTKGRVYMRSKSEQIIGNLLELLHIPYRYEPRIRINNIDYHPDFIIMLPTDKLVILEHVGRMDLAQYNEGLIARLQAYDSANLLIGRDVFLSFEHDTRDEELLLKVLFQMLASNPKNNKYLLYTAKDAGCSL